MTSLRPGYCQGSFDRVPLLACPAVFALFPALLGKLAVAPNPSFQV